MNGAALHNVSNALGAAAAAARLGVSRSEIAEALSTFGLTWSDNPGRCQWAHVSGVELLFDFGHNPHGIEAILGMARRVLASRPGSRLAVSIGQAGDRSDRDITNLAKSLVGASPDLVLARNIPGYERGRDVGEVARMLRDDLMVLGMADDGIRICDDEVQALETGYRWAKPGDLVVTLVHLERERVQQWLEEQGGSPHS